MRVSRSYVRFIVIVSVLGSTAFASTGIAFAFYKAYRPENPAWLSEDVIIQPAQRASSKLRGCPEVATEIVHMPAIYVRP